MAEPTEETILTAIAEAAADDVGPALVYADWLTGRGDVYGEYIALSVADAAGTLDRTAQWRLGVLASERERWLGAVAYVTDRYRWRSGLPVSAVLDRAATGDVDAALGLPAWRTLRELDTRGRGFDATAQRRLLVQPATRDLRRLALVSAVANTLAERGGMVWPRLGALAMMFSPGVELTAEGIAAMHACVPALTDLVVYAPGDALLAHVLRGTHARRVTASDWRFTSIEATRAILAQARPTLEELLVGGFGRWKDEPGTRWGFRRDAAGAWSTLVVTWSDQNLPIWWATLAADLAALPANVFTTVVLERVGPAVPSYLWPGGDSTALVAQACAHLRAARVVYEPRGTPAPP